MTTALKERKFLHEKSVEVFRAVTVCKEQIVMAKIEQEEIKRSTGQQARATNPEKTEQNADLVAGLGINGTETTWLRML